MSEVVVNIPAGLYKIAGDELKAPQTKALFSEAVEEKLKMLLLFKAVDRILSKSKLSDKHAEELAEELRERVAKRHGLL